MGANWLDECLEQASRAQVAVFGDFCLDAYWRLSADETELSVETGLPVRRVAEQRYSLGGAGNVAANLADLGAADVRAIGIIGNDLFGGELRRLLTAHKVNVDALHVSGNAFQTMVFSKPCVEDREQNRIDFGVFNRVSSEEIGILLSAIEAAARDCSVIILNQQVPNGLASAEAIKAINAIIRRNPAVRFVVDSRDRAGLFEQAILKLNAREAAMMLGESCDQQERAPIPKVRTYAARLCQRTSQPVFITRGEDGIVVAHKEEVAEIPGIQILEKVDPVGAGDTVVAALSAVLGGGGEPIPAARFANLAASITVRKLQMTGTATPSEIRTHGADPDYAWLPELSEDPRQARYVEGTEFELVRPLPPGMRIGHVIFDHDGTLSTLREGWEAVMEPMMIRAILGPRYASADAGLFREVQQATRQFIDRTTGIQTLVQMQGLVALVREHRFVPADQILDEHGYKKLYNDQLLHMVRRRLAKLRAGELEPKDFQIKNADALLRYLHRQGVKLYLASGTDVADVREEAAAMGYACLFEDRIFGAVGDVKVEAKKIVLERIIGYHHLSGHQFATFGDGPVELRETHKRGGIAIGIASDEIRRYGFNPAKRARLIRAGADLVIPDFSQLPWLLKLLNLEGTL